MRSKINIILTITVTFSIIFYSTPALSIFPIRMNFLISGSVYLRRPSWTGFRLTGYPTRLGGSDTIRGQQDVEAVVLCSDLSRRNVSSESEMEMSAVCPRELNNRPIQNRGGNQIPTSNGNDDSDRQNLQQVERIDGENAPSQLSARSMINDAEEVNQTIETIDEIEMSDIARAFVIAQFYISRDLNFSAISTLENALQIDNIPSANSQYITSYQLLGNLYEESEQYDKAREVYLTSLSLTEREEIALLHSYTEGGGMLNLLIFGAVNRTINRVSGIARVRLASEDNYLLENKSKTLLSLGRISLENGSYLEAKKYLTLARELFIQLEGDDSYTVISLEIDPLIELLNEIDEEAELLRERIAPLERFSREDISD